jgi:hypothetical protein
MSIKSQQANMKTIHALVSQDLGYIYGERESGPNGAKKQFLWKSAAFLRALGNDLGLNEFKVHTNASGIACSGDVTLMGLWNDGNGLYFKLTEPLQPFNAFLYRTIKSMKDYNGGRNEWLPCDIFASGEYERLVATLAKLRVITVVEQSKQTEVEKRAA